MGHDCHIQIEQNFMSTNKLGFCIHTTFPLVDVILIALEDSRRF